MLKNYPDEKMRRCQEYIDALEEERRKIQVFQRELPLCLELVSQAIEAYKQQLSGTTTECNLNGQSECSEQTCSDEGPVLEEFIPLKRASSSHREEEEEDNDEQQSRKSTNHRTDDDDNNNVQYSSDESSKDGKNNSADKASKKQDWLRSAQLWNQSSADPTPKEESPSKVAVMGVKRNGSGGAFHPFKREKIAGTSSVAAEQTLASSTAAEIMGAVGNGGGSKKEEKESQSQRKQRRCWSPELHRRFLQALQQLGGSHVATPKQIRELMKVDGLTNDEVKSHLQKYRLHTRRPSPSIRNNGGQQPPQFVVVGGIWVPPPEYAAMAAPATSGEAATSNGIYAPIATPPKQSQQNNRIPLSRETGSHSDGGARRSDSPSTSSSTHTTTTTSHSS